VEWQGLVAAYELKTYALKMEGGAEIGAQGWVRYRFREPEQIKMATILSHFAFFSGVGRKTSMGMGQIQ
jgi:CRISPR-associated endoribonuclease Cas6